MRSVLTILAICIAFSLSAQQVARDKVIVEIATGTWCTYCPGAAMGADDLISNGHDVAIIEYHGGDDYQNSFSVARISYYAVTGYPTAVFDGLLKVVGGNHTQSMYGQYLPKYNQRIAIQSSFTIDFEGTNSGMIDYDITVTVEKVATTSSTNMVLHLALTESHIEKYWQGMDELNFVERTMIPNQNGTPLDFSGGNVVEVEHTFSLNPDWVPDNCELVAFVQDLSTKEVLQGSKIALTDFQTSNTHDVAITNISEIPVQICESNIAPLIEIGNYGLDNLTSVDIVCEVNNGTPVTVAWTGNLAYLEFEEVQLDPVSFGLQANNNCTVTLENPNGQPDQFPGNNAMDFDFEQASFAAAPIYLILKTDDNPEETTWELKSSDGTVLFSGGPYSTPNSNVIETFELTVPDCYRFKMYDSGGDGLTGSALFKLADANQSFFAEGKSFGSSIEIHFESGITGIDEDEEITPEIYPNPFSNFVSIRNIKNLEGDCIVRIYDSKGQQVYTNIVTSKFSGSELSIQTTDLKPGIYFLNIISEGKEVKKKIIKTGK
ncbi:MAG: T9SS type A sorting domain-containing protein [Bacteroidales bacterium]|nr:T9SS type A sorting domain-containing protein [Bacteroidales bacterium]